MELSALKDKGVPPKPWYQNLPKDEDIDASRFKDPMDKILVSIADELKSLNIQYIIKAYQPVMSEFYELSAPYRTAAKKYNQALENFIKTIGGLYGVEAEPMVVYPDKYSPTDWGNVYWQFLHLSSILLSYAFENGRINNLLDFPLIVYNIDLILPCAKCAHHYSLIKNNPEVTQTIKALSFGSVLVSLQIFHNIITANIDKSPDYANSPNRDPFLIPDFALKYKCIDSRSETLKKSNEYIKSCIDWQPTTHTLLCVILSTYCSQSYERTSKILKYKLYAKNESFSGINLSVRNGDIRALDTSDLVFMSMTEKQIQYCLGRALLMQFQDTNIPQENVEKNKRLNYALVTMYKLQNDAIRDIVSNMLAGPELEEFKNNILMKLDRVKTIDFEQ